MSCEVSSPTTTAAIDVDEDDNQQQASTSSASIVKKNQEEEEEIRPNTLIDLLKRISSLNVKDTCPICLLQIEPNSRSYTNSCFHCFCFECLFEWSKIKANCPLCKQQFKLIYYDIKTVDDYKEFKIKTNMLTQAMFSSPGYLNHFMYPRVISFEINGNLNNTFLSRICGFTHIQWVAGREPAPERFRVTVYSSKYYASPNEIERLDEPTPRAVVTANGVTDRTTSIVKPTQYRETSAKFYTDKEACTHRLLAFLKRECEVLKKHFRIQPRYMHSNELSLKIIDLVKRYDVDSKQFLEAIQQYIKPPTIARHFQHEFNTFARSATYNLVEYDAKCVYYAANFTKRIDMSIYRTYENVNIVSTHVQTLPPPLTGAVDELLKSINDCNEVIKIDDDDEEQDVDGDDDVQILQVDQQQQQQQQQDDVVVVLPPPSLLRSSSSSSSSSSSNSSTPTASDVFEVSDASSNTITQDSDEFEVYDDLDTVTQYSTIQNPSDNDGSIEGGDRSSYCEEISVASPDCIYLSSDDEAADRPTTSGLQQQQQQQNINKKRKRQNRATRTSCSDEDEEENETRASRNSIKKRPKRNLNSKKPLNKKPIDLNDDYSDSLSD